MNPKTLPLLFPFLLLSCRMLTPATPTPIAPSATPRPTKTALPSRTPTITPSRTPSPTSTPLKDLVIVEPKLRDGKFKVVMADQAAKARALGMKPVAEFGARWCPACQEIARLLDEEDPLMMDAFRGIYLIRLDSDQWLSQAKRAGFDVPYIPAFFNLDHDGRPVGQGMDGNAWPDLTPRQVAPLLKAFFNQ
jgi:thiol-disulfide isomerase/thioredoxin